MIRQAVRGKKVLDVGSRNVDGSIRGIIEALDPSEYVGADIIKGPGVDVVCGAEAILAEFGPESFDIVISTEMVEHVKDWKKVISNLKNVTRREGLLLITTRSIGFPFHGFPHDYWRYEESDFNEIFSDFNIIEMEKDYLNPGIFMLAQKPQDFAEKDLSDIRLYSMAYRDRIAEPEEARLKAFLRYRLFLEKIKHFSLGIAQKVFGRL